MNLNYVLIAVLIMAGVTYLLRMLPITLFRKEIKSPYIRTFLDYTPYAILGAITFPDIIYSTGTLLTACIGTVTALILAYFKRSLVTVAVVSVLVVYLCEVILL